jgi:hypothetical protein
MPTPAPATPSLVSVTPPAPSPAPVPKPAASLAPVAASSAAPATATVVKPVFRRREPERDAELESIDDFGLGESFFERPVSLEDVPGDTEEPPLFTSSGHYETSSPNRRRTVLLVLGCVLLPALIAALVWLWQQRAFDISALPALPPVPVRDMAIRAAKPPVTLEQLAAAQQTGSALFEVGVALFSGYERASNLAVELAAAGFRASTRSIDSAKGRLYEVRTGPYFSHDAAEADAVRIRQIPGYADARVVPPPSDAP